jgi:ribosomal protein S18 acetylase RimI-like enzyme
MKKLICYQVANTPEAFRQAQAIMVEYLQTLGIDLAYMDLPTEFATMPQRYTAPEGVLLLAFDGFEVIGCVGVRRLAPSLAELKRLYVRSSHWGLAIGLTLLERALTIAHELGYQKIRLDVIPTLLKAKEMYRSSGFHEIPPYFSNPVPGTTYMEKELTT